MTRILEISIRCALGIAAAGSFGCSDGGLTPVATNPSLDQQVRQAISPWGVIPILPVGAQNPALVDLGRSLFFDKILSGNRDSRRGRPNVQRQRQERGRRRDEEYFEHLRHPRSSNGRSGW
jgi:hypothetical protein